MQGCRSGRDLGQRGGETAPCSVTKGGVPWPFGSGGQRRDQVRAGKGEYRDEGAEAWERGQVGTQKRAEEKGGGP